MLPAITATFKIPVQPVFPDVTFLRIPKGPIPNRYAVTITPYDVRRWALLHEDSSPWYTGASPWGGPVAMPWILYFSSMNLLGHEFGREPYLPPARGGGGFARYRTSFLAPIPVGAVVTVGGEVTDKYHRNGRAYLQWRLDAWIGEELVQQHWKDWAFPATPAELAGWPERAGSPPPAEDSPLERFGGVRLEMSLDRTLDFEGPIPLNGHNDPERARVNGSPGPLVQGELGFGLLCRVLRDRFGAGFVVGGSTDVRFRQPVYAGQTLTGYGELLGVEGGIARCRIWAENPDGLRVIAGTASARV